MLKKHVSSAPPIGNRLAISKPITKTEKTLEPGEPSRLFLGTTFHSRWLFAFPSSAFFEHVRFRAGQNAGQNGTGPVPLSQGEPGLFRFIVVQKRFQRVSRLKISGGLMLFSLVFPGRIGSSESENRGTSAGQNAGQKSLFLGALVE